MVMAFIAIATAAAGASALAQGSAETQELRFCNRHNETIYVAVSVGMARQQSPTFVTAVSGWIPIQAGNCKSLFPSKYMDADGRVGRAFFAYAETKGLFGGAIKKVWEGNGWDGCMKRDRDAQSWITRNWGGRRGRSCASDEFIGGMEELTSYNSTGALYLNFGGQ